jgi:phosphoserine phosphatase RsbU/P
MLEIPEARLDAITEVLYRILRGEIPAPLSLPPDHPENELAQVVSYMNQFIREYTELADFMYALSRGELDYSPPKGKMRALQSFKNLQANLRHLTWKTQQIAAGDFSQQVDFMGDFSAAFNSMTRQLQQAFADLEHANAELAQKNQQITDSIRYAQRIQQAILPTPEVMRQTFAGQYFVLYHPRDIVSGDFYWLAQAHDEVLLAVADCTGHGVSGAFLSMIGYTLLNKIVRENRLTDPAQILYNLHLGVRAALQQESGNTRDGMEVGICRVHPGRQRVTFAGARRPLYYITHQKFHEIKGDRKAIGGRQREPQRAFTNHEIPLAPGDMLYLCTDGLADQPAPDGKKLGSRQVKTLLAEVALQAVTEQQRTIAARLQTHQQHEPQRDDITILGVRVS